MRSPWNQRLNIPVPRLLDSIPILIPILVLVNDKINIGEMRLTRLVGEYRIGSELAGTMERMQYVRIMPGGIMQEHGLTSRVSHSHGHTYLSTTSRRRRSSLENATSTTRPPKDGDGEPLNSIL